MQSGIPTCQATYRLKTLGHATLLLFENGAPLLATDPWLIGSVYWRSWWLEKYPTDEEVGQVARAKAIYVTHSHPDHFHWPSLRRLNNRSILCPLFPNNPVPNFLKSQGFQPTVLSPATWYGLGRNVRIMSIPVPIDDSLLIVDTPRACIVNLNDSNPPLRLLRFMRQRVLDPNKRVVVLRSYSPASAAPGMYANGIHARR